MEIPPIQSGRKIIVAFVAIITLVILVVTSACGDNLHLNPPSSRADDLGSSDPIWWHTYGGGFSDEANDVKQTADGGFIMVGWTKYTGIGYTDVWLIKTDSEGKMEWNKTFGGSYSDVGHSVSQTSDGGYIIVGDYTDPSIENYNHNIWLIKTFANGTEEWNKTYPGRGLDTGYSVSQTSDEGYIITGKSEDIYEMVLFLIKTDSNGTKEWDYTLGGPDSMSMGKAVQQISDGGFIVAGHNWKNENTESDVLLVKLNSTGIEVWNRTYGGTENDYANSVQQTADGGYIIVGNTRSYGLGHEDIWLIKVDSSGSEQWNKTLGGYVIDYGETVLPTADGGYIIGGSTGFYDSENFDLILIKTDSGGTPLWYKTFGGKDYDFGYSVQVTADGDYVVAGSTMSYGAGASDMVLALFDPKPPAPVANEPPVCSVILPSENETVNGSVKISGTADDLDSYYFMVFVKIDDGDWVSVSESREWFYFWNSTKVDNGKHTIYARAWDGALYSENVSVDVTVDNEEAADNDSAEEDDEIECLCNGFPWEAIFVAVAFIAVIIIMVRAFKRRKKT